MLDQGYVCVDLETTGGNALYSRIIEVGLVAVAPDGRTETFSSLVNPGCRIPSHIESFTGITNEAVVDAPPFEQIANEVMAWLQGRLFVAHNARFDRGFLDAHAERSAMPFRFPLECSIPVFKRLIPGRKGYGLPVLAAALRETGGGAHRALADCRVLLECLKKAHRMGG
jgi:DNA polymerase-3 subunit epsilon